MQTRHVHVVDTTLRDGEQAPGVAFSLPQRRRLLEALLSIGVPEIECGCPAMGAEEEKALDALLRMGRPGARLTAWCRACDADLLAAERCGFRAVHFSFAFSPLLLSVQGKSVPGQMARMNSLLLMAQSRFAFISVGMQDASRTDPAVLLQATKAAVAAGADRVRLADTVGIWTPMAVIACIQSVRPLVPSHVRLGVHMHNDFGMATANTLVAVQHGADDVDVTVTGLGERAGNAPLEQVVMALDRIPVYAHGIDTTKLYDLCCRTARYARRPVPPQQPICGSSIFKHESGIHVAGQLADRSCYEPYLPETVGRTDALEISIGRHSGTKSLRHAFLTMGVELSREDAARLLPLVRAEAVRCKGTVPPAVLKDLYQKQTAERGSA
jgi:homocitrate synthase NifV